MAENYRQVLVEMGVDAGMDDWKGWRESKDIKEEKREDVPEKEF